MKKSIIFLTLLLALLLLASCGSSTLKEAHSAFDDGKYEEAIKIINESEEKKEDNEDLMALYIQCYEKWCGDLISSGDHNEAIKILNDVDEFKLNDGSKLDELYTEAWKASLAENMESNTYGAYGDLDDMIDMDMLSDSEIQETAYKIGEKFAGAKSFAPAALAYAKAGTYKDAEKKCRDSWDKGAFRHTAFIDDYTAVGIRSDGTVASAVNTELIDSVENEEFRRARAKTKIETSGWKDIVSVECNTTYYVGLTHSGELKIGETGYKEIAVDGTLKKVGWKDIVAFELEDGTLAGLNKNGEVIVTGDDSNDFSGTGDWKDIVQIDMDGGIITGVDIYGNVHVINRYATEDDEGSEPGDIPFTEDELQNVNAAQFTPDMYYGVYVKKNGELMTTVNEERAEETEFDTAAGTTVEMDIDDYSGFSGNDFVSGDACYDYYIGLRKNGKVEVGGHMGHILEKLGVSKLKGLKEAHLGIGGNPVVYGVTEDGAFKMAGYEGGQYKPYHERIRAWGKLRKPTVVYDTSEFDS